MTTTPPPLDTGTPELVVDHPSETGEGPLWHEESGTLLWVDIPAGTLFRFDPRTGTNERIYQRNGQIGGYTIQVDGSLVLFCDKGTVLRLTGDQPETIIPEIDALRDSRFNDVIADPEGRVFAGTMARGNQPAQLYRLDPDGSLTLVVDDLTLANGMGFSPDLSTFYLTDSDSRRILQMPYDRKSGELGPQETLVTIPEEGTVPDGMSVDTDGNIWSARWNGHGLYKYAPDGELLGKVAFPVRKVSSVTFGSPDYSMAYVTTAGGSNRNADEGHTAGSLYRVDLKTAGKAPFRSRIGERT